MLSTITSRTMTSTEIAELTGKLKKNVHKDIKDQLLIGLHGLIDGSDFNHIDIKGINIVLDDRGYWKEVHLDRDHTLTLVTGYDVKARYAITKRWMELEEKEQARIGDAQPNVPQSFQLTKIADDLEASHRIAIFFGLEGNQAKLKADKYVKEHHGVSPMALLGIELASPVQARLLTPTEIGKELGGLSPQMVNKLLQANGLQERNSSKIWVPTAKGRNYSQLLDVNKDHSNGTPVQQLKWFDTVIDLIK